LGPFLTPFYYFSRLKTAKNELRICEIITLVIFNRLGAVFEKLLGKKGQKRPKMAILGLFWPILAPRKNSSTQKFIKIA